MIPKQGNSPMLFLEWIRDNNHINNLLRKIFLSDGNFFVIRLEKHSCATAESCMNYINSNL